MSFDRILACWSLSILIIADTASAGPRILDLQAHPPEDPTTGPVVSIVAVTDERSMPGIETERARTIGVDRQKNPILLPAGRSLTELVRELVTTAFRDEGIQVLDASGRGSETHPIDVSIIRFWGSGRRKALVVFYSFDGEIEVHGDLPGLETGVRVPVAFTRGSWGINVAGRWRSSQQEGVDRLVEDLRVKLREAIR